LPALPRTTALRMSDRLPSEEIARACEQIRTCLHPLVGPSFIVRARRLTPNTQSEATACGHRVRVGVRVRESPSLHRERARRVNAWSHFQLPLRTRLSHHPRSYRQEQGLAAVGVHTASFSYGCQGPTKVLRGRRLAALFYSTPRPWTCWLSLPQHNQQSLCYQSTHTSI
jgi:hypothetical protein